MTKINYKPIIEIVVGVFAFISLVLSSIALVQSKKANEISISNHKNDSILTYKINRPQLKIHLNKIDNKNLKIEKIKDRYRLTFRFTVENIKELAVQDFRVCDSVYINFNGYKTAYGFPYNSMTIAGEDKIIWNSNFYLHVLDKITINELNSRINLHPLIIEMRFKYYNDLDMKTPYYGTLRFQLSEKNYNMLICRFD